MLSRNKETKGVTGCWKPCASMLVKSWSMPAKAPRCVTVTFNITWNLAEGAEPQLRSQGRLEWSRRLRIEMDNLRSALDWAYQQENSAQKCLQLVTAISFRFLTPNGYLLDTIDWVLQGLDLVDAQTVEPVLLARSYNLLAEVFENQRNYPAVLEYVQKSLPIFES